MRLSGEAHARPAARGRPGTSARAADAFDRRRLSADRSAAIHLVRATAHAGGPYVIAHYVELDGQVELGALRDATRRANREFGWGSVRLVDIDGQPHQVVDPTGDDRVPVTDLRGEVDPVEAAHRWMRNDRTARTDMYDGPLLVSHILRLGDDHYYWYSRAHHIVSDGYAAMMLMSRTAELYVAAVEGREPPDCRIEGPERLVREDATYRASTRFARDRDYWREQGGGPASDRWIC